MKSLLEIIWPTLMPESRLDAMARAVDEYRDKDLLNSANWSESTDHALEQARRLADQETERRRSAESKASIYLAVIAAIVPVLSSLLTDFFVDDFQQMPMLFRGIALFLFVLGMVYLAASGIWAFRTLAVSAHTRVDATDIAKLWAGSNPVHGLIRDLLMSTRLNHVGVNKKMDYIRMAHEFLLRTFLTFSSLMLVIVLHAPVGHLAEVISPWLSKVWTAAIS